MHTNKKKNITKKNAIKRRGVFALSLLLIVAMVLPQAALATDSANAVQAQTVALGNAAQPENAEISTENALENSGGGGRIL